jgi:rhodanese-related sulfurtransferase
MRDIPKDELIAICKDPSRRKGIHLIDVAPRQEFSRGHIAYAFNVPLEEMEAKGESALPQDRVVVIYGPKPEDAEKAAGIYERLGFEVRVFREGLAAWKAADQPISG